MTDGLLQELDTKMVKAELRRVAVGRIPQWPAGDRRIDGAPNPHPPRHRLS
jgi:hypothetical protein